MRRLLLIPVLFGLAASGTASAQGTAEAGHDLAIRWCASCHVVDAKRSGTDAVPTFRGIAERPGVTAEKLKAYLLKPHGEMPDFQLAFPHIDAIVAYILGLKPVR